MPCLSQTALRRLTPFSFEGTALRSSLGLGCFMWSATDLYCRPPGNAPVLLFSRYDRYSLEATRRIEPRLGHRAEVAPKPGVRSPARVAFGGTSYARTTLAVMRHLSAIGSRRAISDFACPPFTETRKRPGELSPTFASDFLGRGRLLPLSGFNTTTTPCLRAAMGDAHHVLRLSLLGRSPRTFQRRSGFPNLPAQALLIQLPEPSASSTSDPVSRTMMLKTSGAVGRTMMLKTVRPGYPNQCLPAQGRSET